MGHHLFQIFYNETTRASLDPIFHPLDNSRNERPDWREYWPIRNFLLENALVDGDHYGFFAPHFLIKSSVSARQVLTFLEAHEDQYDLVSFSPFPEQHAFFWNVFEQGEWAHPGLLSASQRLLDEVGYKVNLSDLIMDAHSSVFCNSFCARASFWHEWLQLNERLFAVAEAQSGSSLAALVNTPVRWPLQERSVLPHLKVFIMERTASLVLAMNPHFKSIAYEPFSRPRTGTQLAQFSPLQMIFSDAVKVAFMRYRDDSYRHAFGYLWQIVIKELEKRAKK